MRQETSFDIAKARLDKALEDLEAAVYQRVQNDRSVDAMRADLTRAQKERDEMAGDLSKISERAERIEETNKEVSRRLVAAMETIRTVLETNGG